MTPCPRKYWFSLHLSDDKARTMTRKGYYEARSWLRKVRRDLSRRYDAAYIDPANPETIIIPELPKEPWE